MTLVLAAVASAAAAYVVFYVPTPQGNPYKGLGASMALELTDDQPKEVEDDIRPGWVIARHVIRAADAIVLLETVRGVHRDVPAGTPLVRMAFVSPQKTTAWCDVRPPGTVFIHVTTEHDCFADTQGTGKLDQIWEGDSPVHFLDVTRSGVGAPTHALPHPVAFRPARPDERPTATLGYRYCDGDGVMGPPRFALTAAFASDGEAAWPFTGGCKFGFWPNRNDHSAVQVDRLQVAVSPTATPGVLHIKVLNRIPSGPLAPLRFGEPPRTPTEVEAVAQAAARARLGSEIIYKATGALPTIHWGDIEVGQDILSLPIEHAITGVLQNPIRLDYTREHLQAGEAMFGTPTKGAAGDGLTWCALRNGDKGYRVICLSPTPAGYYWTQNVKPALAPTSVRLDNGSVSSDPIVEREPVTLPQMEMVLRLVDERPKSNGDPTRLCTVEIAFSWGEGPERPQRYAIEVPPTGKLVPVMGTVVRLLPSSDPKKLIVQRPSGPVGSDTIETAHIDEEAATQ